MASKHTIEVMGNLIIDEAYREDFIRTLKYGLHYAPGIDSHLRTHLEEWAKEEEAKIDRFEGRGPAEEEVLVATWEDDK